MVSCAHSPHPSMAHKQEPLIFHVDKMSVPGVPGDSESGASAGNLEAHKARPSFPASLAEQAVSTYVGYTPCTPFQF